MQEQDQSSPAQPGEASGLTPLTRALGELDGATWIAMLAVAAGWFFLDTLVVTVGPVQHGVRFYGLATVIADPVRLFVGSDSRSFVALGLALVCLGALCTPLVPHLSATRQAWLACLAPLGLMLVCAALLYVKASGDFLAEPADSESVGAQVLHLANRLINRGSDVASRRVSVGAGAYVAFAGSAYLAVRGLLRYRGGPPG